MFNRIIILALLTACNSNQTAKVAQSVYSFKGIETESVIGNKDTLQNKNSVLLVPDNKIAYKKSFVNSTIDSLSLKDLLLKKGIYFGTVLSVADIQMRAPRPANYLNVISGYFNFYTMSVTFNVVEPKERGVFNFSSADKIVEFAQANHAKVKGHTLVWGNDTPEWLKKGNYSPEELKTILKNHIQTVVKHFKEKYPGVVTEWNVVNEPFCNGKEETDSKACFTDIGLKKNIWTRIHNPGSSDPTDYIKLAFEWAREADPDAKLYLNENNLELINIEKTEKAYNAIKLLKQSGVPIEGIGFQCHLKLNRKSKYSYQGFLNILNRFADLGLETQVSEFDVMLISDRNQNSSPAAPVAIENPSSADLQAQAELYKSFLRAGINSKNFKGFTIWGAWDKSSWTSGHWKGNFQPHILNDALQPKMTYKALENAVENPNN